MRKSRKKRAVHEARPSESIRNSKGRKPSKGNTTRRFKGFQRVSRQRAQSEKAEQKAEVEIKAEVERESKEQGGLSNFIKRFRNFHRDDFGQKSRLRHKAKDVTSRISMYDWAAKLSAHDLFALKPITQPHKTDYDFDPMPEVVKSCFAFGGKVIPFAKPSSRMLSAALNQFLRKVYSKYLFIIIRAGPHSNAQATFKNNFCPSLVRLGIS